MEEALNEFFHMIKNVVLDMLEEKREKMSDSYYECWFYKNYEPCKTSKTYYYYSYGEDEDERIDSRIRDLIWRNECWVWESFLIKKHHNQEVTWDDYIFSGGSWQSYLKSQPNYLNLPIYKK